MLYTAGLCAMCNPALQQQPAANMSGPLLAHLLATAQFSKPAATSVSCMAVIALENAHLHVT
jgi:hypothetical protein